MLLLFLREVNPAQAENAGIERPLREVTAQPTFLIAVLAGAVSYGVMSFIMTATPVMMGVIAGFSLAQTTLVIQSHIVAMYLPSLFTGFIVERLGMVKVMVTGVLLLLACVALGLVSTHFIHFWGALVLLGLGWNFLFVGGTVLLTRSYRPAERFKAQAANDFLIFGIQAFTSLSAGTVLFTANWKVLNLLNLPFLLGYAGGHLHLAPQPGDRPGRPCRGRRLNGLRCTNDTFTGSSGWHFLIFLLTWGIFFAKIPNTVRKINIV